jgi:hypothetical protein
MLIILIRAQHQLKKLIKIGNDAYSDFLELMEKYSITCNEIDFCE